MRAAYELEYAKDVIEMHVGAVRAGQRVLLVDDLIATGGTMGAGIKLMQQARGAAARLRGLGQPAGAARAPAWSPSAVLRVCMERTLGRPPA